MTMQKTRQVIHVTKHVPTGAKIPIIIKKLTNNVIEEYVEFMEKRKGFTLKMLQDRWDMAKDDVLALLHEYQVPGHIRHPDTFTINPNILPADVAIFFEEYIYGLEAKAKLPHNKLKAKSIESLTEH